MKNKKVKFSEMVATINKLSGHGWRARCAKSSGVTYATVFNVINGLSKNRLVIDWIREEYEECQEVDRLINDK